MQDIMNTSTDGMEFFDDELRKTLRTLFFDILINEYNDRTFLFSLYRQIYNKLKSYALYFKQDILFYIFTFHTTLVEQIPHVEYDEESIIRFFEELENSVDHDYTKSILMFNERKRAIIEHRLNDFIFFDLQQQ